MSLINSNPEIARKINDLWNRFWSGGISNPLTAIEQITYLLFMKKLDDNDSENLSNAEFTGETFVSRFHGTFYLTKEDEDKQQNGINKQTLRWSEFKRMPSPEMLMHMQQKVFPFLKQLDIVESPFARHMTNAVFIIPKPSLLTEAIKIIDNIYEEIEKDANDKGQDFQDIQGDVYEMLLSEIASAGKNGQFRTPRHIIKLLVELVNPELGMRIADPACGTGGFLLGAYQYMITQLDKEKDNKLPDEDGFIRSSRSALLTEEVKNMLGKDLFGYDIDQTMVRLGLMNLMMHGIDKPQIDYKDTLSKSYEENAQYKVVLANPPFTGNIDKGDINEELALKTTKTELLFIERIYNMLEMGGTAGMVVPQGVLFGSGKAFQDARKLMIENSELKAVISVPSGVFKPYAGVSTALVIFTKGGETENVWFYDMRSDGYSLDDKRDKQEGYGDLQDIVSQFKNRNPETKSDRNAKFFFVPKDEIVAEEYDLSYSRYREEIFEEIEYEKPEVILNKLIGEEGIENKIITGLKELRELL
jgi:type I restriction enzyme M protein